MHTQLVAWINKNNFTGVQSRYWGILHCRKILWHTKKEYIGDIKKKTVKSLCTVCPGVLFEERSIHYHFSWCKPDTPYGIFLKLLDYRESSPVISVIQLSRKVMVTPHRSSNSTNKFLQFSESRLMAVVYLVMQIITRYVKTQCWHGHEEHYKTTAVSQIAHLR